MHRRTTWFIALLVAVAIAGFALQGCNSETAAGEPVAKAGMPRPMHGKMGKEQMMCMCPMCHMMMGPMMGKSMIATTDGGVVVMVGDKLMKFDKDLNLVKEIKIKMDIEGMPKKVEQPTKECPMHKSMTQKSCPMKKGSEE
jgi:hypothetical protein